MSKTAIVSVADKTGVADLCAVLLQNNYHIYSSGGTLKHLQTTLNNTDHIEAISKLTNYPHLLGGRVKTLHPKVHAGILADIDDINHVDDCMEHNIPFIDLVVVNLYPFEETLLKPGVTENELIEEIDIGGHTLIRASAKNYKHTTILHNPSQYNVFLNKLENSNINTEYRRQLAQSAFKLVAQYDMSISNYFNSNIVYRQYTHVLPLKYGVNPHQNSASVFKVDNNNFPFSILNGSPGYINLLDAVYSWQLVSELSSVVNCPAAASFKHNSPAGVGTSYELSDTLKKVYNVENKVLTPLATAFIRARNADPLSSFGDFIAVSHRVDVPTAKLIAREVSDGIVAPGYEREALEILKRKKRGRYTILVADQQYLPNEVEFRELFGFAFSQERNHTVLNDSIFNEDTCKTDNTKTSTIDKMNMLIANTTLKYTQSNSICFAYDGQAVGVGAGQQNRVDCVSLCGRKSDTWFLRQMPEVLSLYGLFKKGVPRQAKTNAILKYIQNTMNEGEWRVWAQYFDTVPEPLSEKRKQQWLSEVSGVSMASDAFFPFSDSIELANKHGVEQVIQPGGSIRDCSVIEACNTYNMAMYMSGVRVFTH